MAGLAVLATLLSTLAALPRFLTALLAALPWILRLLAGLLTGLLTALLAALIGIILFLLITHLNVLHAFPPYYKTREYPRCSGDTLAQMLPEPGKCGIARVRKRSALEICARSKSD